jgi:hypothetical protein
MQITMSVALLAVSRSRRALKRDHPDCRGASAKRQAIDYAYTR